MGIEEVLGEQEEEAGMEDKDTEKVSLSFNPRKPEANRR